MLAPIAPLRDRIPLSPALGVLFQPIQMFVLCMIILGPPPGPPWSETDPYRRYATVTAISGQGGRGGYQPAPATKPVQGVGGYPSGSVWSPSTSRVNTSPSRRSGRPFHKGMTALAPLDSVGRPLPAAVEVTCNTEMFPRLRTFYPPA